MACCRARTVQRDLSYAQAISQRNASRQAAAAIEPAADGSAAAAGATPAGAGQPSTAGGASAAAGDVAGDRGGPADVPKLVFTIDGHHLSSTTTIFQAVQVCCLLDMEMNSKKLLLLLCISHEASTVRKSIHAGPPSRQYTQPGVMRRPQSAARGTQSSSLWMRRATAQHPGAAVNCGRRFTLCTITGTVLMLLLWQSQSIQASILLLPLAVPGEGSNGMLLLQ